MNPTDQPPSAEAVKAAIVLCERTHPAKEHMAAFDEIEKHRKRLRDGLYEPNIYAAARILAAHARALGAQEPSLAQRCYDDGKAADELFNKINAILGCDVSKCCEAGFVFAVHDCWTDDYDQSVEVIRDSEWPSITRDQADQILAFGFSVIYESYGAETCHGWTKATRYDKYTMAKTVRDDESISLARIRAERSRLESEVARLREALENLLKSATPNERDHPSMHAAWILARKALTGEASA